MSGDSPESRAERHNIIRSGFGVAHDGADGDASRSSVVFRSAMSQNNETFLASVQHENGVWCDPQNVNTVVDWQIEKESLAHCYSGVGNRRLQFSVDRNEGTIHMHLGDVGLWDYKGVINTGLPIHRSTHLTAINIQYKSAPMILLYCMNNNQHLAEFRGVWDGGEYKWSNAVPDGAPIGLPVDGKIAVARIGDTTCVLFGNAAKQLHARFITRDARNGAPVWGAPFEVNAANDNLMILSPLAITKAAGPEHDHYFAFYMGLRNTVYSRSITPAHGAVPVLVGAARRVSRIIGNVSFGATPGALPGSASLFAVTTLHGTKTLVTYTQVAAPPLVTAMVGAKARVHLTEVQHKYRLAIEAELKALLPAAKIHEEKMRALYDAAMIALTIAIENAALARAKNATAISAYFKAVQESSDAHKAYHLEVDIFNAAEDSRLVSAAANKWTQLQPIKTDARVFPTDTKLPDVLPHNKPSV